MHTVEAYVYVYVCVYGMAVGYQSVHMNYERTATNRFCAKFVRINYVDTTAKP